MQTPPNLAFGFATIDRPQVVQRLIRSVRAHLGPIPVYVADQSRDVAPMEPFYRAHGVRLLRMPYDCGVTASRNRLAREIREDFFVLCDDDFVMGPRTSFDQALSILRAHPEIGVVGGRLDDFDGEVEWPRHWELFLEYDSRQRLLISIPIQELAPRAREIAGARFYLCDAVLNFSVMRRAMFEAGVSWDEQFKSNGEHEDFFLNLKLNTPFRVAYLPTMKAFHHHPEEYKHYRRGLRDRNDGWRRFLDKWGLDQHLELGLGVRTRDDVDTLTDQETTRKRFYLNPELSLRRDLSTPDTLLVDLGGRIASVGALDPQGNPSAHGAPSTAVLLLDRASSSLVPGPSVDVPRGEAVDSGPSMERYRLEAAGVGKTVGFADGEFYFRYDAVMRCDRDLMFWYWRNSAKAEDARSARRLAVVSRWTTDTGATLVWKSRRSYLDCREAPFWRPLMMELPLVPPHTKWLRFDIVTDGETETQPVASGFLFAPDDAPAMRNRELEPIETLAITRLIGDGVAPGVDGQTMAELGRRGRRETTAVQAVPAVGALSLARIPPEAGIEALYFQDWRCLGRALVGARMPPAEIGGPRDMAFPKTAWSDDRGRAYAFGRAIGLLSLRASDALAGPAE